MDISRLKETRFRPATLFTTKVDEGVCCVRACVTVIGGPRTPGPLPGCNGGAHITGSPLVGAAHATPPGAVQ